MARPLKTGLEYYPLEVDILTDGKIMKLIHRYGNGMAFSVYIALLCSIYKQGYYIKYEENDTAFYLSVFLNEVDEKLVDHVIKGCIELGLFDKDIYENYHVLTSAAIQRRYKEIQQSCRRMGQIGEYECISTINDTKTTINDTKTTKIKKKPSKKLQKKEETLEIHTETPINRNKNKRKLKENKTKEISSSSSSSAYAHVSTGTCTPTNLSEHISESILEESTIKTNSKDLDLSPNSQVSSQENKNQAPKVTLEQELSQLVLDTQWVNEIISKFSITENDFSRLLVTFKQDCVIYGHSHKDATELKRHLANWLMKEQEFKNTKSKIIENYETTRSTTNHRRRLGSAPCSFSTKAEDYLW